jgi:hypothetical protein
MGSLPFLSVLRLEFRELPVLQNFGVSPCCSGLCSGLAVSATP